MDVLLKFANQGSWRTRMKMERSQNDRLTAIQMARIDRVLAEPRRVQMLREIAACKEPTSCTRLHGLVEIVGKGKFGSLILQRDVLRAYVDRLSTI
jgi:ArsR family transcriptional regulator, arsenate/arsenite/antimonite-responsive transcriptional repressor